MANDNSKNSFFAKKIVFLLALHFFGKDFVKIEKSIVVCYH
jgi:hypothetical protein